MLGRTGVNVIDSRGAWIELKLFSYTGCNCEPRSNVKDEMRKSRFTLAKAKVYVIFVSHSLTNVVMSDLLLCQFI